MKKFRTKYESRKVFHSFKGVHSLTSQQFKDDCTIEGIIKKYGVLPRPEVQPLSADVSEYGDFAENMQKVQDALNEFNALPSNIRSRFGNDPRAFFDFVCNGANVEEAVKLGIMVKREDEKTAVDYLRDISEKLVSPEKENSAL